MQVVNPFVTEIKTCGQLTIPKQIQEISQIEEG
jgi:bifunctional DNA-binding transcriptional regulator/antitoxin component of YhaV-PrlF toxin-antitoxin module